MIIDAHLLPSSALQDKKDDQRDNEQEDNLCTWFTKGRGKKTQAVARTILVMMAIAAAFSVFSIHSHLFELLK